MPSAVGSGNRHVLDPALEEALTDLENASQPEVKPKRKQIKSSVDEVCRYAFENGLSPEALDRLIDVVTQSHTLDQASVGELIRNFYPLEKVSSDVVIRVVAGLGQGDRKPSLPAQAALVRWLLLVYDVLDTPSILSRLYGVLFNLLGMLSLRNPLCQLLALITRRKHVRPFRIQILLELSRTTGNEPAVLGLIRIFKDYYPDIIVGDTGTRRASYFSHPNPEWRQRLVTIHELNERRQVFEQQNSAFKVVRRGAKRSKVSVIPEVHTSHANEASVTLEEVDSVEDFVQKLDRLELPNQAISVLEDPLMQKYVTLKPSDVASKRVDNWLSLFFQEELESITAGESPRNRLFEVLRGVHKYARYTKNLLSPCLTFLTVFLPLWDGTTEQDLILDLASYIPVLPFSDLQQTYLTPLKTALLSSDSADPQLTLLTYHTSLLRRWSVLHRASPTTISSTPILSLHAYAADLSLNLLSTHPCPHPHALAPLTHYKTLITFFPNLPLPPPSPLLTSLILFHPSLTTLSTLCSLLSTYKTNYTSSTSSSSTNRHTLNTLLIDTCNLLWRNRALTTADPAALGCLAPPTILPSLRAHVDARALALPTLFSLSHSAVLAAFSIACFRELEDDAVDAEAGDPAEHRVPIRTRHAGPITQRSLESLARDGGARVGWQEYRVGVLRWLEERGAGGVAELMRCTMRVLMGPSASARGASAGEAEAEA
ncbi:MAG: hypothetical protein M1833_001439 [Piccolia ochrophora]|nr:MAG: hypothetical protein M1833_001439 [Piccolia ochrophora]